MGSVCRTYFRLDSMCLSVEKSKAWSVELSGTIDDIPRGRTRQIMLASSQDVNSFQ